MMSVSAHMQNNGIEPIAGLPTSWQRAGLYVSAQSRVSSVVRPIFQNKLRDDIRG